MAEPRPYVKNAGDPDQVRKATRREQRRREDELNDLRATLSTPEGRRVFWRVLEFCGVHREVWDPSSRIHFNAGRQNVGRFIEAEIAAADQELLFQMMREAYEREKRENSETDAAHTPRVSEGDRNA